MTSKNPINNDLQTLICALRNNMQKETHWMPHGQAPGRAFYEAELIPLLLTRGKFDNKNPGTKNKSDMQEAKELCQEFITGKAEQMFDSIDERYKAIGKAYLVIIYLAEINAGKISASDAGLDEKIALANEAIQVLIKKSDSKTLSAAAAARAALHKKLGKGAQTIESGQGTSDGINYYLVYNLKLTAAKLRHIKSNINQNGMVPSMNGDRSAAERLYKDIIRNITELKIDNEDKAQKRRTENSLLWLKALAKIGLASLYYDDLDPRKIQAGIDLLRGTKVKGIQVAGAIDEMEDLDRNRITREDKRYMAGMGQKTPIASFDYYQAKMLLADLLMKKAVLTGDNAQINNVMQMYKNLSGLGEGAEILTALSYAKLGQMECANANKDLSKLKLAREHLREALEIMTKSAPGTDGSVIIADSVPKETATGERTAKRIVLNRSFVETVCAFVEADVRLFLAEVRSGKTDQADRVQRWAAELMTVNNAREIVRTYMEDGLKQWGKNDKVSDLKDIVDAKIKATNKDIARSLRKVAIWRAELIYAGCDDGKGIRAQEACTIIQSGRDYRNQDRPMYNSDDRY